MSSTRAIARTAQAALSLEFLSAKSVSKSRIRGVCRAFSTPREAKQKFFGYFFSKK
jgi:hypothetical protein